MIKYTFIFLVFFQELSLDVYKKHNSIWKYSETKFLYYSSGINRLVVEIKARMLKFKKEMSNQLKYMSIYIKLESRGKWRDLLRPNENSRSFTRKSPTSLKDLKPLCWNKIEKSNVSGDCSSVWLFFLFQRADWS